ncbi:MAG TPA: hypothetical protein VK669_11360 [Candidatus Limnocylindrales bacterium]|nr:hypothetical protein [Candidatus Limnocylindrales bacterium]
MSHTGYARTAAALTLAVGLFPAVSSAAPTAFADSICPQAAQYVIAAGNLTKSDPAQKVYDTAQAAVDAYARCSKEKLSNGFREPQHYADTRSAQFAIMAARALILLNRPDDARRELKQYRALAQNVVDWQSETETPHSALAPRTGGAEGGEVARSSTREVNQNGHRPSLYQKSAKEIVAAADELLAQIDAQAAKSEPASAATPGHETLHR